MSTELKILDIFNYSIDSIDFTLSENINLSSGDFVVYIDNKKITNDSFSVNKVSTLENTFTLTVSNKKILHSILFFISSELYSSNIFIYFARLNLVGDTLNQLSFLKFIIPNELKSGNYQIQGFKYNDNFISSNDYFLNIYTGISSNSTIKKISSSSTEDIYEISLKDLYENAIPDGIYELEIFFK
ncbi:MAG: hypothetical protein ACRCYE_01930 [Sarcina sp.]